MARPLHTTTPSAEMPASRGLTKFPEGYRWHADQKLQAASSYADEPENQRA